MDEAERLAAERAFAECDTDGNGTIDRHELRELCAELGQRLTNEELDEAMEMLDADGSGQVDRDEFLNWWCSEARQRGAMGHRLEQILRSFKRRFHTDVHSCAWDGDVEALRRLLDAHPDWVDSRDETEFGGGWQPLHCAAYNGQRAAVEALLELGADANARTSDGCTPLFFAAQQEHARIVQLLLQSRADPTICEPTYGWSPVDVTSEHVLHVFREAGVRPPARPGCPRIVRRSRTKAKLAWDPVQPSRMRVAPSKYTVRVYSDEAGHIELYGHLDVLNARCTEAVVPGLAPGCSYRFALVAGSAVGESDESAHSEALAVPADDGGTGGAAVTSQGKPRRDESKRTVV